jgi:hypothetical protein
MKAGPKGQIKVDLLDLSSLRQTEADVRLSVLGEASSRQQDDVGALGPACVHR